MIYTAYYDASGHQEQGPALAVAGLVAPEHAWRSFEAAWSAVLADDQHDVPYLHMTDLVARKGPYEKWEDDKEKRVSLINDLIDVIDEYVSKCFAIGVDLGGFHRVNRYYDLADSFGMQHNRAGAYAFCADLCRTWVMEWKSSRPGPIAHVFEDGDYGQGALLDRARRRGYRDSIVTRPKEVDGGGRLRAFEAADLVGWEARNEHKDIYRGLGSPERESLSRLGRLPHRNGYFEESNLRKMCEENPDLHPPRD